MFVQDWKASAEQVALPIATALKQLSPELGERQISFRAAQFPQDAPFLLEVFTSTREDIQSIVDWTDEQKAAFYQMQFNAQHTYYQEHYADAEFLIIEAGDCQVGRLYIERWDKEFRIIDIALLSVHRQQGIGSSILRAIQMLAQQQELGVTIHVEHYNPALRLYNRLNFRQVDDTGVYYLMEWLPSSSVGDLQ